MTYSIESLDPRVRAWVTRSSNIPRRYWGREPSDLTENEGWPPLAEQWVKSLISGQVIKSHGSSQTGRGLLLVGNPGLGKTTLAVVALMEFMRRLPKEDPSLGRLLHAQAGTLGQNLRVGWYTRMADYHRDKKGVFDLPAEERHEANLRMNGMLGVSKDDRFNVRVLLLDDVGKEYGTKFEDTSFTELVRTRYDQGLPTIITTNEPIALWRGYYGSAMESFVYEAFNIVEVSGRDIRRYSGGDGE